MHAFRVRSWPSRNIPKFFLTLSVLKQVIAENIRSIQQFILFLFQSALISKSEELGNGKTPQVQLTEEWHFHNAELCVRMKI